MSDFSIFIRDTDSNGCVTNCPTTTCPPCSKNEECQLRVQTCQSCPLYYCAASSSTQNSTSSGSPIGPIVGGVVGGVVFLALLGAAYWYYKKVYRKNHPALLDDDDEMMMDGMGGKEGDELSDYETKDVSAGSDEPSVPGDTTIANSTVDLSTSTPATSEKPQARRSTTNTADRRRLSSYESFTRPKTRYNKKASKDTAAQRRARQRQIVDQANQQSQAVYLDNNSSRNSIATSISTTGASNILPIAYIPGVTVRPTKNNTRSIYSYETDSIFSDLNTIENALIIGDVMRANNAATASHGTVTEVHEGESPKNGTMTAIKAQPRLVNVDRIEEEDYDDVTDEEDEQDEHQSPRARGLKSPKKPNLLAVSSPRLDPRVDSDSDLDSDIDSDIGEITRAASMRRGQRQTSEVLDIPLDLMHNPPRAMPTTPGSSGAGSFILDVEMDKRASDASSEKSPFEDPPRELA